MAKEEMLEFEGVVAEVLPDARCRVKLDNGHEVIAYTSGRMKKNRIRILAGDRVTVERPRLPHVLRRALERGVEMTHDRLGSGDAREREAAGDDRVGMSFF